LFISHFLYGEKKKMFQVHREGVTQIVEICRVFFRELGLPLPGTWIIDIYNNIYIMKWIKDYNLFESNIHNLPIPKTDSELEVLRNSKSFRRILSIRQILSMKGKIGKEEEKDRLTIGFPGEVFVCVQELLGYCFSVSKSRIEWGRKEISPRWTKIDSWDKAFDWLFIYAFSHSRGIYTINSKPFNTGDLFSFPSIENFVFNGVLTHNLFLVLKALEQNNNLLYKTIIDLAKEYNGEKIEEVMDREAGESSKPISDLEMILKTNAHKKATSFLGQSHTLMPKKNYIDIFVAKDSLLKQIMDKDPQTSWDDTLSIALPKIGVSPKNQDSLAGVKLIMVKTMKGLDSQVTSRIKDFLEDKKKDLKDSTSTGFLIDPIVSWFIGNEDVTLYDGIRKWFVELKKTDPIEYATKVKALDEISLLKDLGKELIVQDPDLIDGSSIIRRFGFGS